VFDIGQWAFDNVNRTRVQVLERNDLWGHVSYRVYDPLSKEAYTLAGDCLDHCGNKGADAAFVRYIAALAKVKGYLAEGMLSDLSENVLAAAPSVVRPEQGAVRQQHTVPFGR
jgi:hypothetical protein